MLPFTSSYVDSLLFLGLGIATAAGPLRLVSSSVSSSGVVSPLSRRFSELDDTSVEVVTALAAGSLFAEIDTLRGRVACPSAFSGTYKGIKTRQTSA